MQNSAKWYKVSGLIALAIAAMRLILRVNGSFLGTSVSCGNAIGYLTGGDNQHPNALAICRSGLQNATLEGVVFGIAGVILLIVARSSAQTVCADQEPSTDL